MSNAWNYILLVMSMAAITFTTVMIHQLYLRRCKILTSSENGGAEIASRWALRSEGIFLLIHLVIMVITVVAIVYWDHEWEPMSYRWKSLLLRAALTIILTAGTFWNWRDRHKLVAYMDGQRRKQWQ